MPRFHKCMEFKSENYIIDCACATMPIPLHSFHIIVWVSNQYLLCYSFLFFHSSLHSLRCCYFIQHFVYLAVWNSLVLYVWMNWFYLFQFDIFCYFSLNIFTCNGYSRIIYFSIFFFSMFYYYLYNVCVYLGILRVDFETEW